MYRQRAGANQILLQLSGSPHGNQYIVRCLAGSQSASALFASVWFRVYSGWLTHCACPSTNTKFMPPECRGGTMVTGGVTPIYSPSVNEKVLFSLSERKTVSLGLSHLLRLYTLPEAPVNTRFMA